MAKKRILELASGIEALNWDNEMCLVVAGYWHPDREFPAWRIVLSFWGDQRMRWNAWKIVFPGQTHLTAACPWIGLTLLHANAISMDEAIRKQAVRALPDDETA